MRTAPIHRYAQKLLLAALLLPSLVIVTGILGYRSLYRSIKYEAQPPRILRSGDAIAVFGAAVNGYGYPTKVLQARLDRALALYNRGKATRFILTGGVGWNPPAESVAMRRYLVSKGVPLQAIHIETRSNSTLDQVKFIIRIARKKAWKKIITVSDPLHLYRIRSYFAGSGLQLQTVPAYRVRRSEYKQHAFIQMEMLKLLSWYLVGH